MKKLAVKEAKELRRAIVGVLSRMPYRVRVAPVKPDKRLPYASRTADFRSTSDDKTFDLQFGAALDNTRPCSFPLRATSKKADDRQFNAGDRVVKTDP